MTMTKTLELTKSFDAPVTVVFDAIKEGQLLICTGVKAGSFKHDFKVGGEYTLSWAAKTDSICSGRYLEIKPNELVKFTWLSRGCDSSPAGETVVTVTLKDCGATTELTLVHEGLEPGLCYDDHLAGWTSTMVDLNAEIERLARPVRAE